MTIAEFPRLNLALVALGLDNGSNVNAAAVFPQAWLQRARLAEVELRELTLAEIETLAAGEQTEREPIVARAPNADAILQAAFDGGPLAAIVFAPWENAYDARIAELSATIEAQAAELVVLRKILNTPVVEPFAEAVALEAKHQIARHGEDHDAGKDAFDWFWTLGYLGGKAARADKDGDIPKALHHTITAAALLANWHRFLTFRLAARSGQ